ncbi:flavohemoprotein [Nitzschia inconspicua]|uniref:Flavohemoprotein n=1 Tax=Nitzschia inconspicua TaxID=303405 RepID=A0A9K3M3U5_9STRA|nr:flavohemoprotein [Nitzschia inconspicua]
MNVDYRTVRAVDESWLRIREIPNYEQVAGQILFRKIFELAPAALGMYQFGSEFETGTEDKLYQHPVFLRHAKAVVQMLDLAINLMGPDMDPVTVALKDLGARHTVYGVLPPHYEIVGQALLHTLEVALGDGWTEPVKKGWIGVYTFVSTAMMEGAEEYLKEKMEEERAERKRQEELTRAQAEEAIAGAKARAAQAAKKKGVRFDTVHNISEKNQLPVVTRSRKSLGRILLGKSVHSRSNVSTEKEIERKKIPNSRIEDRGLVTWLDKALNISRHR